VVLYENMLPGGIKLDFVVNLSWVCENFTVPTVYISFVLFREMKFPSIFMIYAFLVRNTCLNISVFSFLSQIRHYAFKNFYIANKTLCVY